MFQSRSRSSPPGPAPRETRTSLTSALPYRLAPRWTTRSPHSVVGDRRGVPFPAGPVHVVIPSCCPGEVTPAHADSAPAAGRRLVRLQVDAARDQRVGAAGDPD